jgi:2-oxoglutarate ferredoxin oxidoreductase subunit alpha
MATTAFDLAEEFQTPVFVNSDLDLGMNNWTANAFEYPEAPQKRGKVLTKEDLDRLGGFMRYADLEGNGVGWRTLPGTNHPAAAYFTRGSGHNEKAGYTEKPEDYVANVDRLSRKFDSIRAALPHPIADVREDAKIGLVYCGTSRYGCEESRDQLSEESGIEASLLRLLAYPFGDELESFIERHERVYLVDQNRDAQLLGLMRLDLDPRLTAKLRSIRHYNGLPLDARTVTEEVIRQEGI